MIIVRLKGGMGNQMFQYALGRVLSIKNNTELKLDISFFNFDFKNVIKRNYDLNVFNISAKIAQESDTPFIFRLYNNKTITYLISLIRKIIKIKGQEKSFSFDKNIFSIGGNVYLDGYFQSPKYFAGFEDVVKNDFTLKNIISPISQKLANEISSCTSLCINVRRADFVVNGHHGTLDANYYYLALEKIKRISSVDRIYIFSDDIDWCKNNLFFDISTTVVNHEHKGRKFEEYLYLMSMCKHFIIPNSTFGWWAAWLSNNKHKVVICPKKWFGDESIDTSDLIPKEWIRI